METPVEYRLKKANEEEIFGPLSQEKLRELAESALIAPDDLIDQGDNLWKRAPQLKFLGMVWTVETGAGVFYGPTTLGTIREFYGQGEIKLTDQLTHLESKVQKTVGALLNIDLGRAEILGAPEEKEEELAPPSSSRVNKFDADALKNLDRAKDLRIRQLEIDLERVRDEHEQLLHKFRKLTEDFIQAKKAVTS